MRFKDFLREGRKTSLGLEQAVEVMHEHCKIAMAHGDAPLYRGSSKPITAAVIHGEMGSRESAHTSNHYTVIFDTILPKLGYPKRTASTIFANHANAQAARSFGTVHVVMPYDDVKIGVCDDYDIWYLRTEFAKGPMKSLEKWNIWFEEHGVPDYTFEDMVTYIEEVLADYEDDNNDAFSLVFIKGEVEDDLRLAYRPDRVGLHLASVDEIYSKFNSGKARELWVGGKCLMIDADAYATIKDNGWKV